MRQTLFYVPHRLGELPLFGWGWLLIAWAIFSAILLGRSCLRQGWNRDIRGSLPLFLVVAAVIAFVLPHLEARAPDGTVLGLPIRGYGLMLLTALVCGLAVTLQQARRVGLDQDLVLSMAFWMILAGIVGARLFYIVQNWASFRRESPLATLGEMAKFTEGGLVVYGSLIGGLLAFVVFTGWRGLPRLASADVVALGMVLGQAIGRIGCLFNGCCYGAVAPDFPLAIEFPRYTCQAEEKLSPPYLHQLATGQLHGIRVGGPQSAPTVEHVEPGSPAAATGLRAGTPIRSIDGTPVQTLQDAYLAFERARPQIALESADGRAFRWSIGTLPDHSLPVHPTQLYAAVDAALLFLFLWSLAAFRPCEGYVFASMLTIHPVSRFLLEMIRDDEPGRFGTPLTISQLLSLVMLAGVAALWVYLARRPRQAASA